MKTSIRPSLAVGLSPSRVDHKGRPKPVADLEKFGGGGMIKFMNTNCV